MPTFRQRPLTWLFIAATCCLDAVGAARAPEAPWFDGILAGQVLVAGGWSMLGRGHRLAGGGAWIAAVLAVTWLASRSIRVAAEWRYVLGSSLLLAAAAAGCALVWRIALGLFAGPLTKPALRFPLAELFGWTIVVAAAATAFREAVGVHLQDAAYSLPLAAMAAAASLLMVLFLAEGRPRAVVAGALSAVMVATLYLSGMAGGFSWLGIERSDLVTLGFVAAWIVVVRFDEQSLAIRTGAARHYDAEPA